MISKSVNQGIQQLCAWAGPVFVIALIPVFWLMEFLPPPGPSLSPEEMAAFYDSHRTAMKLGASLTMQLAFLGILWSTALAMQFRRIEAGRAPILTSLQLLLGFGGFFVIILPTLAWTVAAFRPERDIQLIALITDTGWLALVMPVLGLTLEALVIGTAILLDTRKDPLYPRWSAYFSFWCGILFLPGALASFFFSGPFAWDGLFVYWLPLLAFIAWIVVLGALTSKAINKPDEPVAV